MVGVADLTKTKTKLACILEANESTRMRMGNSEPHNHEDHFAGKGGGESALRTLQSGYTAIRADQFDPDGWQLPEITELCQDNDEGCGTNYMSVIAHVYQRPKCMDNNTSAGDHDPAPTRSCRPRQKTTSNGNGPARSHPTIFPTSSPR